MALKIAKLEKKGKSMDLTLTNSFDVVTSFFEPEISFFSDLVLGLRPFRLDTVLKTNYRNSVFFYIELTF